MATVKILTQLRDFLGQLRDRAIREKVLKEHGFLVFCPSCKNLLNYPGNYAGKVRHFGVYVYTCKCGEKAYFNFDVAPCPLTVPYVN